VLDQLELAALGGAEHLDDHGAAGAGDPAGLAQRGDHVVGEEERREARHEVERAVGEGQRHHVAVAELRLRHPAARDGQERLGRVEAGHLRAAVGAHAQEDAGAAADVQDAVAGAQLDMLQRGGVDGVLLLLRARPVARAVAPQLAPQARGGAHLH
jgi:hypothetical protein